MDVEEFVRRRIAQGQDVAQIRDDLSRLVKEYKPGVHSSYALEFSDAVIQEVRNTSGLSGDLFTSTRSGVKMGEFGVGSRGTGDFFAHRQIARIIGKTGAVVGVDEMDDAGVVPIPSSAGSAGDERGNSRYVVCTVDGMHSRLSDFPYLAGFHATRATLRDAYVMGARPVMLFSDIHVADDGDVAKIFDYTAGITTVGEAMGVPLVSGSTLRIGGDMVLGSRMTGCVGTVGLAGHLTARRSTTPGDVLLMTEGAGGGTIATAALYSGFSEVVEETINLHFLTACETLLKDPVLPRIHAMTDVTNGGLRGDAHEMAETAGCRIVIKEKLVSGLVQPRVRALLERLSIDYLGVSLDSLLIVAPAEASPEIMKVIASSGVRIEEIGYVEEGKPAALIEVGGELKDFTPRFREAAYTPVKKVVDRTARDFDEMKTQVEAAALAAIRKKEAVLKRIRPVDS